MNAIVFIPLTQGKAAVIDFDDFEKVRGMKWHAIFRDGRFHARGYAGKTCVYLHRFLLDAPAGMEVDHKDGDGLNNRRYNIRVCTKLQNRQAYKTKTPGCTSRYRGVCWNPRWGKWKARITFSYADIYLGGFDTEEDAARAYDKKARELFGEYASPNFP